jgi:hypothetical protein
MVTSKTLTFAENPRSAKLRFQHRTLNNWLFAFLIFTAWAAVVAWFEIRWLADFAAMAVLFYFVFLVWEKRAIKFRCPHCEKSIRTNRHWICGSCGKKNVRTDEFPFIHRCQHDDCGAEPTAYKCHHCDGLIFLTEDEDKIGFASSADEVADRERGGKRAAKRRDHKEIIEDKEAALAIAVLDAKLKEIRERSKGPKIRTLYQQKKEAFEDGYDAAMGIRGHARNKKAQAAEEFKDDPESLKEANEAIDDLLRRFT